MSLVYYFLGHSVHENQHARNGHVLVRNVTQMRIVIAPQFN